MTSVTKVPCRAAAGTAPTAVNPSGPEMEVANNSPSEYRDWAGLMSELVSKIGDHLVLDDMAEYIRMRAVCKPWRNTTEDPIHLEPRYFPRNWLLLAGELLRDDGEPERFMNVRTGAVIRIRLPTPREYTHHGNAEGLLVLHHHFTDKVRLLNPLTLRFDDLPTMASMYDQLVRPCIAKSPDERFFEDSIKAAGIVIDADEQGRALSLGSVVLSLVTGKCTGLVCAEPGDKHWRPVDDMGCPCKNKGNLPLIEGGGLSVRGRFYLPSRAGDVFTVVVEASPHIEYVARMKADMVHGSIDEGSYLVPSLDDNTDCEMLLLRSFTLPDGKHDGLMFAVDLCNRSLSTHNPSAITVFLPSVTLRCSEFHKRVYFSEGCIKNLLRGDYIGRFTARRA
ncbi:hypothetical protein QOZ80_5BG0439470 [Eleusine coracana subsp. coracana]|nr:hypothetical protein QOZ80_5BG0439470 [Eleusine coracana subsp. coracana]